MAGSDAAAAAPAQSPAGPAAGGQQFETDENGVQWGEDEFGKFQLDKVWTMNEIRDHPMFMEDVPSDISDNPALLALQSLVYDDKTPQELAVHFKDLGNEAFRSSTNKMSSKNALICYSKGLEMDCKDNALNSQIHSNRAAVSMRLKQNDKAVNDCRKAVKLDPKNTKAYYRGAKASEAQGLVGQALRFCVGALEERPDDDEFVRMRCRLQSAVDEERRQQELIRTEDSRDANKYVGAKGSVVAALEARGSGLGPVLFDLAMYFQGRLPQPKLLDAENGPGGESAIDWPLLFLYDESSQSDYVESFDERCTLQEQLQLMFPEDRRVDWDSEGKYTWDKLVGYLEYYRGSGDKETEMRQISLSDSLRDGIAGLRVPQCLVVHVLVEGSGAHNCFCVENHLPPP